MLGSDLARSWNPAEQRSRYEFAVLAGDLFPAT